MPNAELFKDVKEVFDQLSVNGFVGDYHGELAYCYLRVSSSGQAEEGRSGLPRQIMHVHETAVKHKLKIPWELVFADDHTGFQFRDRPDLNRLRQNFKLPSRRAHAIVIENLDRLSRNADWHQGFLLDEMKQYGLNVIFWKSFTSRIERAVIGAISQEGMEQEIRRMADGTRYKAQSGRVTAHTRAYGFIFVDAEGKESFKAKKDTYYAHHPQESEIMRLIYHKVGIEGVPTRALASYLEERFSPPGRYKHWEPRQIALFIRNSVYKGEFVANKIQEVRVPMRNQRPSEPVQLTIKRVHRPKEEWITVPVPPIVTNELWEMANRALDKNAQMGRRNGKRQFLLTGLITCAKCGYSYAGGSRQFTNKDESVTVTRYYRCTSRSNRVPARAKEIGCTQGQLNGDILEDAVWNCVCKVLLEPQVLFDHLDSKLESDENVSLRNQIKFLEGQIIEKNSEDEKLYKAYMADVFDEHEYAARRELIKESRHKLEQELEKLCKHQITQEQIEEMREVLVGLAERAAVEGLVFDAPFEIKQRVIKLMVNRIVLNVAEQWLRIEGDFPRTLSLDGSIESNLMGRGSLPQLRRNWPET